MSAIILRKNFSLKTFRNFILYSFSYEYNSLRIARPRLNLIIHKKYLASVAHQYKTLDNSNTSKKKEFLNDDPSLIENTEAVHKAIQDIDFDVKNMGRIHRKYVKSVLKMFVDIGCPTKTQSLQLIRSCGLMLFESPSERVALADTIWKKLKDMGHEFNIDHWNALLKVYTKNYHEFSPSSFLTSIEENNLQPNRVTFKYLLEKYCNDGDLNGASEILEFMQDKGLSINETSFNTLIKGHMRANDISGAKEIFEVMRSAKLSPSADTYTALACGYAEKGDISGVKSVLKETENNYIILHLDNYLSVISSLSSDEHVAYVDELIGFHAKNIIYEYRHYLLNTAVELIHKGLCEIPFRLVSKVSNAEDRSNYSTNIFLSQLIKVEMPIERVLHYCNEVDSKSLNRSAFLNSAKASIDMEKFEYTLSLYQEMLRKGLPIRTYNFWPILSHHKNSEKELLSTLKTMFQLGIPADFATFDQYIYPAISVTNPENIIAKIQDTGHAFAVAVDSLFHYYCSHGHFDNACFIIEKYPVKVYGGFDFKKLFSFLLSGDVESHSQHSFTKVLRYILENFEMYGKDVDVKFGRVLASLIQANPNVFVRLKDSLIEKCKYNPRCFDVCYNILKENAPQKLVYLEKFEKSLSYKTVPMSPLTIEEEEKKLSLLKEKGLPVDSFLKQLLSLHIKEKNFERIKTLKAELDELGIMCSALTYAKLFHLYCQVNDTEMAGKYLKTLKEHYPDFRVDTARILDYATLLLKASKFDEMKDIIKTDCSELHLYGSKDIVVKNLKRLFDIAVDTGNLDLIKDLQNSLLCLAKELQCTVWLNEAIVKIHLYRKDLDGAVNEFRNFCINQQVSPCLELLLKKCIVSNDHLKLETVIDLSSVLEGKHAVHHKVILAFFETGRKMQAVKLIETLGPEIDVTFLEKICDRLYNQKRISDLEDFISMIKDLEHIKKENLFYFLFKSYHDRNDYKKALDLFHLVEKENLFDVTNKTRTLLSDLCTKNNMSIPFSVPEEMDNFVSENSNNTNIPNTLSSAEFQDLLSRGDVSQALEKLHNMKKGLIRTLPLSAMTQFLNMLVKEKRVNDISQNIQAMSYIIENATEILKPLYEKFSEAGDIESMHQLASFLPDFTLKKSAFNSFMGKAYISCGKHEEFLVELENRWNKRNKMFAVGAFEELLKVPSLKERAINLAKKYLEVNFDLPLALVWAHYLVNENFNEATELNKLYSVAADKVDIFVLKAVRQEENIALGRKYIEAISKMNARLRCKERAYGTLLDVLVLKEMYDEAIELITEIKQMKLNIEKHYRSTLITLKAALERENKHVPFTIPSEDFIISG